MLPKRHRLRIADFQELRGSRVFHSPHFLLQVKTLPKRSHAKAAAVVSLRVGGTAVARNRLRRHIYAALDDFVRARKGFLLTVTAKNGAETLSPEAITRELSALLPRAFCSRGPALL